MSLISKWYSTTLAFGTDDQNTPEVDLQDSFEAIEIDIPTIETAEVQIKGSNQSAGTFDLIGQEEPIPSSTGDFRTTVPLGGKYRYIKVYLSAAQTADRVFAVRGVSYASAGLVALIDRIKNMRIDVGDIEVNTEDIEDGIDELKALIGTEGTAADPDGVLLGISRYIAEASLAIKTATQGIQAMIGALASGADIDGVLTAQLNYIGANLDALEVLIGATDAAVVDAGAVGAISAKLLRLTTDLGALLTLTTNLSKAEDAAHTSGDKGVMALGVRKDKHEAIATTDGKYSPQQQDKYGGVRLAEWEVGKPELRADNSGWAVWEKRTRGAMYNLGTEPNRQFRQGPWAARLNGGLQKSDSWEDWAAIWLPINEMKLTDLDEIMYTYYKFLAGTADVGPYAPSIGIRVHDPANHDARAEITLPPAGGAAITEGWHETFLNAAASLFYFGDNMGSPDICTGEGPGNTYTWAQFQADIVFSTWTVYQIEIFSGFWGGTNTAGDAWIGSIQINDIPVKMEPADLNDLGTRPNLTGNPFGEPELRYNKNSIAYWSRGMSDPRYHASGTGWQACLHGRLQTGDDWAACYIPVNELPLPLLSTARWAYILQSAQTMGMNIVIWVHDPANPLIRAEITQLANVVGLTKTEGRNAHVLNQTTDQFFYYGEGIANTSLITGAGPDNLFGLDDFQGDERFNSMTIYRISFGMGWEASGTFDHAWLADLVLNDIQIPLKPRSDADLAPVHTYFRSSTDWTTGTAIIAPKTPFQLLSVSLHLDANPGEAAPFIVQVLRDNDKHTTDYDTVIHTSDMFVPADATSRTPIFGEGYEFAEDDVIDVLLNGSEQAAGLVITWKPL